MRILMISHGYPPSVSGVTLITQKYSRMLVKRGHEVTVIAGSDTGKPYDDYDEGIRLIRLRSFPNPYWAEAPIPYITTSKLKKIIQEFDPDLIHSHENTILSTQLLRLKKQLNLPMISSAYSLPIFLSGMVNLGWIEAKVLNYLWRFLINNLNQYDRVIFSNNTLKNMYQEHGLKSPTSVISNGVDDLRYRPDVQRNNLIESEYNLPPHPRILYVGRIAKDKQINMLIEAMPEIHSHTHANLIVVGRGDYDKKLERLITNLAIEHCVKLIGFVPEEDLPGIYQACDLFALVACCETQSIPALQALTTGLPLVLANAGCLPELVKENENGFLVKPNNIRDISQAIIHILEDPERHKHFSQASINLGTSHAESISIEKFIELYESIINKRSMP